jgi:hypothetical protein
MKLMSKEEYLKMKSSEAKRDIVSGNLAATDNLWSPQQELTIFELVGARPRKMQLAKKGNSFDDNFVNKLEEIQGSMVFYINRDEKGKPLGEPKKYLQLIEKGGLVNKFIDGDKVQPFFVDVVKKEGKGYYSGALDKAKKRFGIKDDMPIASNFTGLDDINVAMNKYGADGLDLSNASGLDDSILEKHSNLINENLLSGLTENTSLLNADGEYSNLINESLLSGLTENTSLLNADGEYSNLINENLLSGLTENTSLLNADGEDYSNGIGDWFKKTFNKKNKDDKKASEVIANPQTDIVEAKVIVEAHKESGSKKPLREWLSSGGVKEFTKAALDIATVLLAKKDDKKEDTDKEKSESSDKGVDEKGEKEVKILGMSPITFGIVTVGVLALTSVIVIVAMRKK